jgi:putative transport protein
MRTEVTILIELLIEEPLLLLFIVSALGYAIGRIKIKGISLGIAAVLFVGLAFGALDPQIKIPAAIFQLGLVIFVYTIGLSSGPGFFASFKRKGLRDNLFVLTMLLFAALVAVGADMLLGLKSTITSGLYAGSLTNTPALAGVVESITSIAPADQVATMAAEPVIGYSVAYPMGVLGPILVIFLLQRLWKINYKEDAKRLRGVHVVEQELYNRTVRVTQTQVVGVTLDELVQRYRWGAILGRMQRDGVISLATGQTILQVGDLVSVIGTPEDVDAVVPALGELSDEHLELDRSEYDFRRIFVSHPHLAGMRLADLNLAQKYGALVTRVRRGDIDFLAHGDTVLELGDRVRVVAHREQMKELSELFGDSYKELSEVNLMSLGLGLTLGLLVGLIPIPLPGGVTLKLGLAGGPLVVGLILGALRRTGPVVWTLPYSANLTLRQVGLILLLAAIGVNAGYTFVQTLSEGGGLALFAAGAVITCATALLATLVGYKVLKVPYGVLTGMLAALHTQPAVLGFSLEQSDNELPNIGYALAFPVSTIAKIVIAQLLLRIP